MSDELAASEIQAQVMIVFESRARQPPANEGDAHVSEGASNEESARYKGLRFKAGPRLWKTDGRVRQPLVLCPRRVSGEGKFGPDQKGVRNVLSHHVHTTPRVFVLEGPQNTTHAAHVRQQIGPQHKRGARLAVTAAEVKAPTVLLQGDGASVTGHESHQFTARVGGNGVCAACRANHRSRRHWLAKQA